MTCKDCIHYPVCSMPDNLEYICEQSIRDDCEYFMRADNTVEVVRCKDCRHCKYNSSADKYKCDRRGYYSETVEATDYCSWGERREG